MSDTPAFDAWRKWFQESASQWNDIEDVEGALRGDDEGGAAGSVKLALRYLEAGHSGAGWYCAGWLA